MHIDNNTRAIALHSTFLCITHSCTQLITAWDGQPCHDLADLTLVARAACQGNLMRTNCLLEDFAALRHALSHYHLVSYPTQD
jgi:hypothetical protein